MDWNQRVQEVQKRLRAEQIDGWLLYDFQGNNALARDFLQVPFDALITRRAFYWIPCRGEPIQLIHEIESHVFSYLPGKVLLYQTWKQLHAALRELLKSAKIIAMEYSPEQAIPSISKVDAGFVDIVRSFSIQVVSSGSLLQHYTSVLDENQLQTHLEAAHFLDDIVDQAWNQIRLAVTQGKKIDEYQIRQFLLDQMTSHGFITEGHPICAVNAHSANPHFEPSKDNASVIQKGDFVLIDLWCKKNHPRAIYADITRVAVVASLATQKQNEVFSIVREAQKAATDFIRERYCRGEVIKGYEVDEVCRQVIVNKGYGSYFTHRTGHNIYTKDHGPGAHLDSFETYDTRELIPQTCFSIEPGIYLPEEFGVRLEYDIYLSKEKETLITGGIQDEILCLLS